MTWREVGVQTSEVRGDEGDRSHAKLELEGTEVGGAKHTRKRMKAKDARGGRQRDGRGEGGESVKGRLRLRRK